MRKPPPVRRQPGPQPGSGTRAELTTDQMAARYLAGATMEEIGREAGVSRERVRQLLPADVKAAGRSGRRARTVERVRELVAAGWSANAIADELGYSDRSSVYTAIDWLGLRDEWEAAAARRRGTCRVCGDAPAAPGGAATCGGFCRRAWMHLRRRLDPDERRRHRVVCARWALTHGVGTEHDRRMIETDGRDVESHGAWFVEGSSALAIAAECVRRGYRPVIDALGPREMEQVRAELELDGEAE